VVAVLYFARFDASFLSLRAKQVCGWWWWWGGGGWSWQPAAVHILVPQPAPVIPSYKPPSPPPSPPSYPLSPLPR
jgi:hypothetical protein